MSYDIFLFSFHIIEHKIRVKLQGCSRARGAYDMSLSLPRPAAAAVATPGTEVDHGCSFSAFVGVEDRRTICYFFKYFLNMFCRKILSRFSRICKTVPDSHTHTFSLRDDLIIYIVKRPVIFPAKLGRII